MIKKTKIVFAFGWTLLLVERIVITIRTMELLINTDDGGNGMAATAPNRRKRPMQLQHLTQINQSFTTTCPQGLVPIRDRIFTKDNYRKSAHNIPLIVHQTSKSRCLAPDFATIVDQWKSDPNVEYYFHDDEAVNHFLSQDFPEFPTLSSVLSCVISPTLKADLWRYLLLWEYGGIYADLDTLPNWSNLNETSFSDIIHPTDYGYMVVDHYHYASQYFMAMAPRHVLMYYTVQAALSNILLASDTGTINPARTTGPTALHTGLQALMADAGMYLPTSIKSSSSNSSNIAPEGGGGGARNNKNKARGPITEGIYPRSMSSSSSVRIAGTKDNQIIQREGLKRGPKNLAYQLMGMQHFSLTRVSTNISCLAVLYDKFENQKLNQ